MTISFLRRKTSNKSRVKFINRTEKQVTGKITFSRRYGQGVLLVTIDLKGFELCQGKIFQIDW